MKKISLKKAMSVVKRHFNAPVILKTWDTSDTTEILFEADGETYELLSNADTVFTSSNPFVIFKA